MTTWGVTRGIGVLALVLGACTNGNDAATTTTAPTTTASTTTSSVPERPASTTTTDFDPASVEGQVEAAYLKSWDVYADAVYNLELDEPALASVYAGEGLANITREIRGRVADSRAALVVVDHDYEVHMTTESIANVLDQLTNHQVLIDPVTKAPTEADPNETEVLNFVMKKLGGEWHVTLVQRL